MNFSPFFSIILRSPCLNTNKTLKFNPFLTKQKNSVEYKAEKKRKSLTKAGAKVKQQEDAEEDEDELEEDYEENDEESDEEEDEEKPAPVQQSIYLEDLFDIICSYQDPTQRYLALVFYLLPSAKAYPDYYEVIKKPIDLKTIASKIKTFAYQNLKQIEDDLMLMCDNAKRYNDPKEKRISHFHLIPASQEV